MATSQRESYEAGKIVLEGAGLFRPRDNQSIDINELIIDFTINSSLYNPYITADVMISDASGIFDFLPLTGDEYLILSFHEPQSEKRFESAFRVYKVGERERVQTRSEMYRIHAISPDYVTAIRKTVENGYTEKRCSDIVQRVFSDYIKVGDKDIEVTKTGNEISFVAPSTNPFDAISWVASESVGTNSNQVSNFVFYEDFDKFNFANINDLLAKPAVKNFYYSEQSTSATDSSGNEIMLAFEVRNSFDTLKNTVGGLYSSETTAIDTISKQYRSKFSTYHEGFDKSNHLGDYELFGRGSDFSEGTGSASSEYIPQYLGDSDYNSANRDSFLKTPSKRLSNLGIKKIQQAAINNLIVDVAIPGTTELNVGECVNLYVPSTLIAGDSIVRNNRLFGEIDPKFLVTNIEHIYNVNSGTFYTKLECVKESLGDIAEVVE